MKKLLCAVVIFSSFVCLSLFAKTWQLQFDEQDIGSVEFPDSWEVNQSREFVDGWSPDKASHIVVQITPISKAAPDKSQPHRFTPDGKTDIEEAFGEFDIAKERDEILEATAEDFKDDQVEIDPGTKKVRDSKMVTGTKGLTFEGERAGKPLNAGCGVIVVKESRKFITFTYWCLKEKETEHRPEIGKVLQSIKPVQGKEQGEK